jgi:hypothetical protein
VKKAEGFGVGKPDEEPFIPTLFPVPVDPTKPVLIKRVGGCMQEVTAPDARLLRKPNQKHEHAALEEHQPGESIDHRGTKRTDN